MDGAWINLHVPDTQRIARQLPAFEQPLPLEAAEGSSVFAGTFVHGGALTIKATRAGEDSMLGKIVSTACGRRAARSCTWATA